MSKNTTARKHQRKQPRPAVAAPSIPDKPKTVRCPREVVGVEPLLCARPVTARLLGDISIATVIRMEEAGKLDKVRPGGSDTGVVFHKYAQVKKLAGVE